MDTFDSVPRHQYLHAFDLDTCAALIYKQCELMPATFLSSSTSPFLVWRFLMKRRLLSGFVVTAIFAVALISARTAAACRGALGCFPVNENCGVTCNLTGEDSEYCYYDCDSDCSAGETDKCYSTLGLEPVT